MKTSRWIISSAALIATASVLIFLAAQNKEAINQVQSNLSTEIQVPKTATPLLEATEAIQPSGLANNPVSFSDWLEQPVAKRDLETGIHLAKERRKFMAQLIRSNPEQALALAIDQETKASLPEEIAEQIEKTVQGAGDFNKIIVCMGHGDHSEHDHEIRREVAVNGQFYRAHTYGRRASMTTKENIPLFGIEIDGHMALHEAPVQILGQVEDSEEVAVQIGDIVEVVESMEKAEGLVEAWASREEGINPDTGEYFESPTRALVAKLDVALAPGDMVDPANPPSSLTPPTDPYDEQTGTGSHQLGPKTVMLIRIQPSDGTPWDSGARTEADLNSDIDNASQWYYDQSYRKTWFGPKVKNGETIERLVVTPVLPVAVDNAYLNDSLSRLASTGKSAVRALGGDWNGGVRDPNNFDRIVIVANDNITGSTGFAFVGGRDSWVGAGQRVRLTGGVALHEWGHNWGVVHANYWVGDNGIPRNASGSHDEYGDGNGIMGGGGGFNPLFKERLYFLEDDHGDIVNVESSGTYRLFDHIDADANNVVSKVRALKVPITGTSNSSKYLMLGFSHQGGTDGELGRSSWNRNAVEVRTDGTSTNSGDNDGSHFLDTTPGSRSDYDDDRDDGAIMIGRTYSEPANLNGTSLYGEIHITPVARGNTTHNSNTHEYIDVVVNLGDYSSNQAPTGSLQFVSSHVNPGESLTISANATDPDGDSLAYSWVFGDDRYSINNNASQTISYPSSGLYEVVCEVTDMKGGILKLSQWINVGGIPSLSPSTPAGTIEDLHYQYYEGSFSIIPDFGQLLPTTQGTVGSFSTSPKLRGDDYAFLYEGFINAPATEVYTFYINASDGARLYVGGQLVVDNGSDKSEAEEKFGNIALDAGLHHVRLEFFTNSGNKTTLDVDWKSNSATGNERQNLTSAFLSQIDPATNAAPTTSITAPTEGATIVVGNDINLTATAADTDGIEKVVYFAGSTYIGESDTSPYSVTFTNAPIGQHALSAVAYDNVGRWTQSTAVNIEVTVPEIRRMISVNIVADDRDSDRILAATDEVGAIFAGANWNNVAGNRNAIRDVFPNLKDSDGAATPTLFDYEAHPGSRYFNVGGETLADTSTPAGKMMRGAISTRFDTGRATYRFENVPYQEYDVYVYFDAKETQNTDAIVAEYQMTQLDSGAVTSKYGRNSTSTGDGTGDYPTYDTFTGFKEATATTHTASNEEVLGNYVVFRGMTSVDFQIRTDRPTSSGHMPAVNGIQVIEAPASFARVDVLETSFSTEVAEVSGSDTFDVTLSLAPTNGATVTVDLTPDTELNVNPSSLDFTAADFDTPQTVTVTAVDDTDKEPSPHTGLISFAVSSSVSSNYDAITRDDLSVEITDDDMPTLDVVSSGTPTETNSVSGTFRITRSNITYNANPQIVSFGLTGTATAGSDYGVNGATTFNNGTAEGTLTIPGGSDYLDITITPIDDQDGEGGETVIFGFLTNTAEYEIGTPSTANLEIVDNEVILEQNFDSWTVSFSRSVSGNPDSWTDGSGDQGWVIDNSGTPSVNTGPTADNTTGSGNYIFTEASGYSNQVYEIITPSLIIGAGGTSTLEFYYSMFGSAMGTLHIDIENDGTWTQSIFSLSGQQTASQAEWKLATVDLSSHVTGSSQRIRFRGIVGTSFTSDIAIDDVRILGSSQVSNSPPSFASHPNNTTVTEGDSIELSAIVSGTPTPALQWKKDGVDIPGATTNPLSIPSASLSDSGSYTLVATNSEGSDTSNAATVTVNAAVAPTINSHPVDQTVESGSSAGFSVSASGTEPFTYQWKKDGINLSDGGNISGATTDSLVLSTVSSSDEGDYTVVVTNAAGSDTSDAAALNVNAAPVVTIDSPSISPVGIALGASIHLDATVVDTDAVTTTWSKVSGPGAANFGDSSAEDTTVSFDANGSYVIRLLADDGSLTGNATINIKVGIGASSPTEDVPAGSIVGYWKLNGNISDDSGNRYDGSLENGASYGIGIFNQGVSLDGVNDLVDLNAPALINYGAPITKRSISLWFKAADISKSARQLIFEEGGSSRGFNLFIQNGTLYLGGYEVTTSWDGPWLTSTSISDDTWHHIAITLDGGASVAADAFIAYLDGAEIGKTPGSQLDDHAGENSLGAVNTNTKFPDGSTGSHASDAFEGMVDQLVIYNRVLTPTEVSQLSGGGSGSGYQESGGLVVIEAEDFSSRTDAGGQSWTVNTGVGGYSGSGLVTALANNEHNVNTGYTQGGSPRLDYEVNFQTSGTYHVWFRGSAANLSDDSVHASINDQVISTSDRINIGNSSSSDWVWKRSTMDGPNASLTVPSTGTHTFNLYMREDGAAIDKIIITTDDTYTPTGAGPDASARSLSNDAPVVSAGSNGNAEVNVAYTLEGSASDVDGPSTLTTIWSLLSGPSEVVFGDTGSLTSSVTFATPGSYVLKLEASDAAATTLSTVDITVASPAGFATWAAGHTLSGSDALMDADPDKDGIINIIEYAFGLNPKELSSNGLPQTSLVDDSGERLQVEFTRDTSNSDLIYEVQISNDMSSWTVIARSESGNAVTNVSSRSHSVAETGSDNIKTVRVKDGETTNSQTKRFIRVKITAP